MKTIYLPQVFRCLIGFLLALAVAQSAFGQNTWTGNTSTDWNTPGNWSAAAVPVITDDVVIPSGPTRQPVISTTAAAKSVVVNAGASLSVTGAGSLTIDGSLTHGITNSGTLTNGGSLYLGSLSALGDAGILNNPGALIKNVTGGYIQIDRTGGRGIANDGAILNAATITIGSLTTVTNNGIFITPTGSFTNDTGGNLIINRSGQGLVVSGVFLNSASVTIGNVAFSAQDAITNSGTFTNNATGEIRLDRAFGNGIWHGAGTLLNAGKLIIGTISGAISGMLVRAPLTNSGEIQVNRGTDGMAVNSTLINTGQITIGNSFALAGRGMYTEGASASIVNTGAGTISIDRTGGQAIQTISGASFTNSATITIGVSVSGAAIANAGTFSNAGGGCAALSQALIRSSGNGVITNTGSFSNTGLLIESSTGNSSISFNGGVVQNLNGGTFSIGSGSPAVNGSGLIWTGCTGTDWNTASNWSTGSVPAATDDVVIPSDPANQPVISTTAVAKSVEVQTGASLSISSPGGLTINGFATLGGYPNAFYNQGTVTNDGTMVMGNMAPAGQIGLRNTGTFTNTGSLRIDQITNEAIINGNVFANTGLIAIGSAVSGGFNALWNQAAFSNSAGGRITIDRAANSAVYNTGSNFVNSATLTIGASASVTGNGLTNEASFTNATGGLIQIDRAGGRGIINTATFMNAATINIGSVTTVNGWGLHNASGSSFSNVAGSITINRSGWGLINDGTFVNSASVTVGNIEYVGQDCLYNAGTFTNNATGEIRLDRGGFNGIWNIDGSFKNIGKLIIGAIVGTVTGIYSSAPASFTNTGAIQVDRYGNGIVTNSMFTNTGQIALGTSFSLTDRGIIGTVAPTPGFSATFVNSGAGNIRIGRTGGHGIQNVSGASFINSATVSIGISGSIGGDGINNDSFFSNTTCATLTLSDNVNNTGSFTNAGFFTVSTTQSHTNTGTLTNNGVISYPQGNPIPDVTNNDLTVTPLSLCGTGSTTALQIGGANSFSTGTTWYTDAALTTVAGTYDSGTNTFTPASLSAGTHTVYFTVTDTDNNCARTGSVSLTVNALPVATLVASGSLDCAQTSVTLTASGGSSYTFANAGGVLGSPGSANTLVVTSAGTYSVTVSNANGCTAIQSTSVAGSTNLPSLTATAASRCLGVGTAITATAGFSSYTYVSPFTSPTITGSGQLAINPPVSGIHAFTVIAANALNCRVSAIVSVTILALPTATIAGGASNTLTCTTPVITLTATGSATNLLWPNGATTNTINVSAAGVYSVTATNASGCTAVSNSLTISQNQSIPGFGVSSVSACQGQTISLQATGCTGGTVVWSGGTTGVSIQLTAGVSGSALTATCTVGSCSTTASGSVVVGGLLPPPAQILSLRSEESGCPVQLIGQGVGTSFVFTGPGNSLPGGYVFSNVFRKGSTYDLKGTGVTKPGVYTLTATYTNECGTSTPVSRSVTVGRSCP